MAKVMLKNVRISFPDLFEAQSIKGGTPRYSATFLFEEDHPCHAAIKAAIAEVVKAKWLDKANKAAQEIKANGGWPIKDGDIKEYAGYEGNLYIRASNKMRPQVIDRDKSPLTATDGKIYSGCRVNAQVDIYAMDSKDFGKQANVSLLAVQFHKDDERFSGGSSATLSDFDDESGEDDGGDFDDDLV